VEERSDGGRRPKGRRLRYAVGELLSCPLEQVVAQAPPPANGEGHVPPAHGR